MIANARGNDAYTLWLTNREDRLAQVLQPRGNRTVQTRDDAARSVVVALEWN